MKLSTRMSIDIISIVLLLVFPICFIVISQVERNSTTAAAAFLALTIDCPLCAAGLIWWSYRLFQPHSVLRDFKKRRPIVFHSALFFPTLLITALVRYLLTK